MEGNWIGNLKRCYETGNDVCKVSTFDIYRKRQKTQSIGIDKAKYQVFR